MLFWGGNLYHFLPMKGTKTRKDRMMCKNKSVYHYGKTTHAIFMSVGFGILEKKTKNTITVIMYHHKHRKRKFVIIIFI